jgi:hypothetical protein
VLDRAISGAGVRDRSAGAGAASDEPAGGAEVRD